MNRADLIRNMEATAQRLTGRPVQVRIKHYGHVSGLAQRDGTGRAVIDLDPALFDQGNIKAFARIFAHEVAHILKHYNQLPRRDIDKGIDQEIARAQVHIKKRTAYKTHEDEADYQAAYWMQAIEKYLIYYSMGQDPHLAVLKILYHHPNG